MLWPAGAGKRPRYNWRLRRRGEWQRQWQHHQQDHTEDQQRVLPAGVVDQRDAKRRKQELAERAGRRPHAERDRPPACRQELGKGADHDAERTTAEAEPNQHAGRQMKLKRRFGIGHPHDAADVEQSSPDQHPGGAEAIGERAGERLAGAPQQHFDRQRQREHVAAPAVGGGHRRQKKSEGRARPKADQRDQTSANEDDEWGAPGSELHRPTMPPPPRAGPPAFPRSAG